MMNFADGTSRIPTSSVRLPITPNPSGVANLAPPPGETPYATQEFVYELFSKIKDSSIFPATDKTLGGVIVGSGLTVGADGRIDVVFPSHADYLTKTDASSTYAKLSALTDYLTVKAAGSTYATKTELERHVPFVVDRSGTYTAALVGTFAKDHDTAKTGKRSLSVGYLNSVTGDDSIVVGKNNELPGTSSVCFGEDNRAETQACVIGVGSTARKTCMALGYNVTAGGGSYSCAMALGRDAIAEKSGSFVWNGQVLDTLYSGGSRLGATFNVNPVGGIEGFYIGEKSLKTILSEEAPVQDLSGYVKKTASGGISLGLQYNEDQEHDPLFLNIEGAVRMGQPSSSGDEALLEMQAGGRPGGFKVHVSPFYDESTGEEVSSTAVSIDDIPDVAAELRKISAKRDRTDNTAAKDGSMFSAWKFHCGNPELQTALDGAGLDMRFAGIRPDGTVIETGEYEWVVSRDPGIPGWTLYDVPNSAKYDETSFGCVAVLSNDDPDDYIEHEVSATRTKIALTKSGELYVTPTGVKALVAPGFSQLVPGTSEGKVTLKPVDGKANWAPSFNVSSSPLKIFSINLSDNSLYYTCHDSGGYFTLQLSCDNLTEKNAVIRGIEVPLGTSEGLLYFEPTESISLGYNNAPSGLDMSSFPASLEPGSIPYCSVVVDFKGDESDNIEECNFSLTGYELYGIDFPSKVEFNGQTYYLEGAMGPFGITQSLDEGAKISVTLPDSTDHACSFSLALTTDAKEEQGVTWEGADKVIEAFPGAKKLAPGTTVWDVKEVMPGTFLVDRAPATSGTPTIVGDNGTTYTLGVDTDGTLEVRQ